MAHLKYHNKLVELNNVFYESHSELITMMCIELKCTDRIKEFHSKFIDKIKLKPKKDPDEPKKPRNSYMYYCDTERKELLTTHPKMLLGQQSKTLGNKWSKINNEEKKVYIDKANNDRTRYEEEIEKYNNIWSN